MENLEKHQLEKISDNCLEGIMRHISDFEEFYQSRFVKDTENFAYGFSPEEQKEMLSVAKKLRENILDKYEKDPDLYIISRSQLSHLLGNSILVFARNRAQVYEKKKKDFPESIKKNIKETMERLNFYLKKLSQDKDLLEKELTQENGFLDDFSRYFKGKVDPRSPQRILIFKFFYDLKTQGIPKDDFSYRLEEIDKETRLKNFLDINKMEQEGLVLIKENGKEIYKFV